MSVLKNISGGTLVAFAIGIAFMSATVPSAITNIFAVDTISWDAGSAALWALIPLAIIGGLALMFAPKTSE